MRSEQEKRDEVEKLLTFIFCEWQKPITDELISYWLENLRGKQIPLCRLAARLLVAQKPYHEPKYGDFADCIRRIETYKPLPVGGYNPWRSHEDQIRDAKHLERHDAAVELLLKEPENAALYRRFRLTPPRNWSWEQVRLKLNDLTKEELARRGISHEES